uniref:Uncharacterized protein n=1 Tax=Kalanchoe fedtschenkoi TaxID=63787 RepID=A0A7N0VA70_KALFE
MTRDDPQSPLQQHSAEVNQQQPHTRNLNFPETQLQQQEPHFPETLILDPQITEYPPKENNSTLIDVQEEDLEEAEEDSEPQLGMSLSSPSRSGADTHVVPVAAKPTSSRRRPKRKRMNKKQFEAVQHKVQRLMGNLKLIPFVPNRALDFGSHENLLRRLGLWDFVHVELDGSDLRADLIAQLVVNYKKVGRVSEVNGFRVKVSRADLGRSLKLPPVKKDCNGLITIVDEDAEFSSEKTIRFVEELMSNWMLLHDEDTWILPEEVMHWIEMIRKGHPDRVEWASLVWYMVEKELSQGLHLVDCYYASHLQHLMKHQNERLFLAEPDEDVSVREEEEEEDGGDVAMVEVGAEHVDTAVRDEDSDEKMAITISKESEFEKMDVSVNEVLANEKINEEFLGVKASDANIDTHKKEFNSHIETDKSNDFMDLHNDCLEVKSEKPSVELTLGQDNIEQYNIEQDDIEQDDIELDNMEQDNIEQDDIEKDNIEQDAIEQDDIEQDNIEQDNIGKENAQLDHVMNFDDLGLGDSDNWQLDENNAEGVPFLRQCSLGRDKGSFDVEGRAEDVVDEEELDDDEVDGDEDVEEDEEEGEEEEEEYDNDDEVGEEGGIDLPDKFDSLQGISSHIFQGVNISQGAFGSPLPVVNQSPMQHFSSHAEASSTAFGNTLKRTANHEQNVSYRSVTDGNKRIRCDDTWDHQEPSDFYRCMENIEHWMGKAKMMYAAKEQECAQMNMNQQLLYAEVQQRNHMIEHQEKNSIEVRQKSHMEILKLDRELIVMEGLLDSYRKALKEIRREFSEYRARCPLPEEPLYKDAGPGGVVLSGSELERQRLKQVEEDRMKRLELESAFKSFEAEWYPVFEGHHNGVHKLDEKLLLLEEKVKILKCLKTEEIMDQPTMTEETTMQPAMTEETTEQPATTEEFAGEPATTEEITAHLAMSDD